MEVAEMVLSGAINKEIVSWINRPAGDVRGRPVRQGRRLIIAREGDAHRRDPDSKIERVVDLGFVGEPVEVDPTLLERDRRRETDPGDRADRRRRRTARPTTSTPTRGRRHRRRAEGQAPAAPDRRAGRARRRRRADPPS